MARLDVPDGPGGEAAMIWALRPQLGGMVERMIRGAYPVSYTHLTLPTIYSV